MKKGVSQEVNGDKAGESRVDLREALFNDGSIGPFQEVQQSCERITRVNGILLDLDPALYRAGPILPRVPLDPIEFFQQIAQNWFARHPVLDRAELRMSGTGLHGVLWVDPPPEFQDAAERDRWDAMVRVIQAVLPTDPGAPSLTACTRPVGSVNSKNGEEVIVLKAGERIPVIEVEQLFEQMASAPFRIVFQILTGDDAASPCPNCAAEKSRMAALDFVGRCYECGNVKLSQLYDLVFRLPEATQHEGDEDVDGNRC